MTRSVRNRRTSFRFEVNLSPHMTTRGSLLENTIVRRARFALVAAVALVWSSSNVAAQDVPSAIRPNVVLIYMDDLGYGDIAAQGAVGYQTPHIDRLCAEGMRFTHFNVAHPVCSASRAALLTGCYANRVGFSMALTPNSEQGLNHAEVTLAETLSEAGYHTAIVGKWHLGDRPEAMPLRHGFDEFFGLPYSNDQWRRDYVGSPLDPIKDAANLRAGWPENIPVYDGVRVVDEIRDMTDMGRLTARYTERACEFIRRTRDAPFFLYLAHSMPHFPIAASEMFRGRSEAGLFGDVMIEIDWSVGEVMRALEEQGLTDKTLVIFTSDNGPESLLGEQAGSTGGLRGSKVTTWEGGNRVPFVARLPRFIPAGGVCNRLAANIDLYPTIAELAGASPPPRKIDGLSLLPLLRGDFETPIRRELYYYFQENDLEAVRLDDWKLVLPHVYREVIVPGVGGWPGKARRVATERALYNLRDDPGETLDVQSQNEEVVARLEELAARARRELGDGLTKQPGAERRPPYLAKP